MYCVRSACKLRARRTEYKSVFFSKDMNVYLSYGRIFEAEFALKSRGFGDFGSPSGQDKSVKDFVSITYEAQGVLEKNIMS